MQVPLQLSDHACRGGKMNGVAYDTAWTAQVTDESGNPIFPECIRWLLENQNPDGSWGSQVLNYHDRIMSTLGAIMALKKTGKYEGSIRKGEAYIWENIIRLSREPCKLVASELLIPSLMEQAESLGLNLPYHIKIYQREYQAKLSKIDQSLWYSPLTTLSHSIEFLGENVDENRLSGILLPNGCVGNSPAATAFFLMHTKNVKALWFLKQILQTTGDGSVMTVYPINLFEYLWTLYNLMLAGLYFEEYAGICELLRTYVGHSGLGMSTDFPIPDADDTSVLCKILSEMQYSVDFTILDAYDAGEYFSTYTFEVDPSVSTNIHVLDCVKSCFKFPQREETMDRLVHFLRVRMISQGFWIDKWHISPYYPTSHAILALCNVDDTLAGKAVSWLLDSQNENGTWGRNGGTLEETALAAQALIYYHRHVERIDIKRMCGAFSALNLRGPALLRSALPSLWIGKVLYVPMQIVWSSIAGAQFMTKTEMMQMPVLLAGY